MANGGRVESIQEGLVAGYLHLPEAADGRGLVLAHGAGSNAQAPILRAAAQFFCERGMAVLRLELPFRQRRPHGPPPPGMAEQDRRGMAQAAQWMLGRAPLGVTLGGHSYGGRQATLLAAEQPAIAARLLLLSYPLHPPAKPAQLRTAHFGRLSIPALFVHGTRDGFGTIAELGAALAAIPARTECLAVEGAGHDLRAGRIDWAMVGGKLEGLCEKADKA